jgi:hypothetical protein
MTDQLTFPNWTMRCAGSWAARSACGNYHATAVESQPRRGARWSMEVRGLRPEVTEGVRGPHNGHGDTLTDAKASAERVVETINYWKARIDAGTASPWYPPEQRREEG